MLNKIISIIIYLLPATFVFADGGEHTFASIVNNTLEIVFTPLVALLVGLGLVIFFWGLIKYLGSTGNDEDQKKARDIMVYGIIGLFIMISVWSFVNILASTFFADGESLGPPDPLELFDF